MDEVRPLAVVDIDGVVADVRHRLRHLEGRRKDWDAFFAAAVDDPPHLEGVNLVRRLAADHDVLFLTGRPERLRADTAAWLEGHGLGGHDLAMRSDGDRRPAAQVKLRRVRDESRDRPIGVVVDDDPLVVATMREAGYLVLHADWETRSDEDDDTLLAAQEVEGEDMTEHGSELVDYEAASARYHGGRALPDDVLARWRDAVTPHLPPRGPDGPGGRRRVLDLGAGTGIFAAVWPAWGATHVVAVEVSAGMTAGRQAPAPWVRGQAEALPLTTGSVDLVWASTSFHHFRDQPAAVAEIGRVLAPGGRVMIRAFLPERAAPGWFGVFPGRERALERCISVDGYAAHLRPAGLGVVHVEEVPESATTFAEAADWAERMRHADSLLTALTDEEVAEGVRRLRARPDESACLEVSLVVLARGG